jgi:hypothetical protein
VLSGNIPLIARLLLPAVDKFGEAFLRNQAWLQCAVVAVAAERYRRDRRDWPKSLDALVAAKLLASVAIDPYDGKPIRLRETPEGLIVYSLGPDMIDDDGKLAPDNRNTPATTPDFASGMWPGADKARSSCCRCPPRTCSAARVIPSPT